MSDTLWTRRINEMAWGFKNSAILLNAISVGLFESLAQGPRTAEAIATERELAPRAVTRVLDALVALEMVRKEGQRYAIDDEVRDLLAADSPNTLKSILGHTLHMMRGWSHLDDVMRTDEPVDQGPRTEQQERNFILGMENISRRSSRDVLERVDMGRFRKLLDLGGGPATAAITFAQAHQEMECVVYDRPGPLKIANEQIEKANLTARVTTHPGDFHTDELPTDFDGVYLSNVMHMLDEKENLTLLCKARQALAPGGKILVKDFFVEECRTTPRDATTFSVNMLVHTRGGKTYTLGETKDLLEKAGFEIEAVVDVARVSKVLEAGMK